MESKKNISKAITLLIFFILIGIPLIIFLHERPKHPKDARTLNEKLLENTVITNNPAKKLAGRQVTITKE